MMSHSNHRGPVVIVGAVAALALAALWWTSAGVKPFGREPLVVYCAHDAVYSEEVLHEFSQHTGIPVQIRFDTEATKSLGLVNLIREERAHPRCDVFWNNELLGTLELQSDGLLEPYHGSGWERIPEQFRDPDGHWVGFGARLRVWIVNITQLSPDEAAIHFAASMDTTRVAMAMPMFGTTLTQYAVYREVFGEKLLQSFHREMRKRGMREVAGNAAVKDLVAAGTAACGLTDTDDYFVARDDGAPVEMVPVRYNGRTIAIPNTAAIIRGTKHRRDAERLVDFLASEETELKLARSRARQIPLGPADESQIPEDVRRLREWAKESFDLRNLLEARREVLDWLRTEYVP